MNLKDIWDKFIVFLDELLEGDYTKTMQETAEPQPPPAPQEALNNQSAPIAAPAAPSEPVAPNPDVLAPDWGSQERAYHNTRVLCDLSGLTVDEKNIICACLYQESTFLNYYSNGQAVKHENLNPAGVLLSTDWGIAQINDYWHVKKYADFPSAEYILANPDKAVQFMIDAYKNGGLGQWVSYSSGAYKYWLLVSSPMWKLAIAQ